MCRATQAFFGSSNVDRDYELQVLIGPVKQYGMDFTSFLAVKYVLSL